MKNTFILISIGIILISLTSAIHSGETFLKTFDYPILNCSIENNSSDLEGLEFDWMDKTVIILTQVNYRPDNFTLICWLDESYYSSSSSRGSSHHKRTTVNLSECNETNWICNPFELCIEGETISRFCINDCGRTKMEYKWCNHTEQEPINLNHEIPEINLYDKEGFFEWLWNKISSFFKSIF